MAKKPLRLTNSRAKTYQRCPRLEGYSYQEGYRPRSTALPLRFGTAFHDLREQIWRGEEPKLSVDVELEPEDRIKVEEMARGYVERWGDPSKQFDVLGVETFHETPLFHPDTGETHPTEVMAGKIDSITRAEPGTTKVIIWDGKTTSESIEEGSPLWARLVMDSQISQYFVLAIQDGWDPVVWMHDVVKKPGLSKLRATPAESLKYRKPKTAEEKELPPDHPSLLYKSCRIQDESDDDYRARLREDIASRPEFYFVRRKVERLDHVLHDHLLSLWGIAERMKLPPVAFTAGCVMTGLGQCSFLNICAAGGHPRDYPDQFEQVNDPHPELER